MFQRTTAILTTSLFIQLYCSAGVANDNSEEMKSENERVAELCKVADSSFEEYVRVSDAAFEMNEAGQFELAAICYTGLVNGGYEDQMYHQEISINYSKAGICEKAEEYANKYNTAVRKFWIEKSDHFVASNYELLEEKDWADFSNRPAIVTPYDDVEDLQFEDIKKALKDCRESSGK